MTEDQTAKLDAVAIRRAWSRETSASPDEWSRANRARGQCAVTAVIVREAIGGRIIRTMATWPDGREESHYANVMDNDVIVDLTESQFSDGTTFGPWEERTKEYILSYPATMDRYLALVRRLNEIRVTEALMDS